MTEPPSSTSAKPPAAGHPLTEAERTRRSLRRVAYVMLAAVVIYFGFALFSGIRKLGGRLYDYTWWTFAAALALAFSNYLLRFLKWEYYLRLLQIRGIPKGDSFLIFLSGFVLSVTPGKVGEVFKSYVMRESYDVAPARTAPIVVAERLTDLIGIIVLIAVGSSRFSGGLVWASAGAILVSAILIVITFRRLSGVALRLITKLPGPFKKAAPKLHEAYESLFVLTRPRVLIFPTLISIAAWFLECLALWFILKGFGQSTTVLGASFFYATATLAGALIPVPGGLGIAETVMQTLMQQLGSVDQAGATGAMLLVRFATLWFAVIVGFVALSLLRRRHPKLLG